MSWSSQSFIFVTFLFLSLFTLMYLNFMNSFYSKKGCLMTFSFCSLI